MAIFIPLVTKFDSKGVDNAQRALASFKNFAVDVAKVAAAAVAGVAVASVREAVQFETTFSRIQGLVGLTTDEIEVMEEAARRLGPQFGKSGNEAADALFFITSAGLRGQSAIDVLEASLKGAAIGLGDVGSIANAATAAMNTYGESNLSGSDAVEALAEAVRLGQFAPEELAGALGRVIPVAAELGVSFEETTGLVAALTKGGLSASEAVTGIAGVMQAVLKPTSEAATILEKYGTSADGVKDSIEQNGLFDTLTNLRETMGGNSEDFLRLIGSQEGLKAALALTGENTDAYAEIVRLATDDINIMDEAMAITADTAQHRFDVGMATAKDSLLGIGASLLERVLPYLDDFQTFMEENGPGIELVFDNIFEAVETVGGKLGEVADIILPRVMELFNDEQFQENVKQLGENFLVIADQVIRFIDSDFGEFLGEFINDSFIGTLKIFNDQLERLAGLLFAINQIIDLLSGKGLDGDFDANIGALDGFLGIDLKGLVEGFAARQALNFASGGIVMPRPGGTIGRVGEAGQAEAIIPLTRLDSMLSNAGGGGGKKVVYNITVNAGLGAGSGTELGEKIVTAIKRYERSSGPVFVGA